MLVLTVKRIKHLNQRPEDDVRSHRVLILCIHHLLITVEVGATNPRAPHFFERLLMINHRRILRVTRLLGFWKNTATEFHCVGISIIDQTTRIIITIAKIRPVINLVKYKQGLGNYVDKL